MTWLGTSFFLVIIHLVISQPATVIGNIVNINGTVSGDTILIIINSNGISQQAVTDKDGHFEVKGVPEGKYSITLNGDLIYSGDVPTGWQRFFAPQTNAGTLPIHIPSSPSVSIMVTTPSATIVLTNTASATFTDTPNPTALLPSTNPATVTSYPTNPPPIITQTIAIKSTSEFIQNAQVTYKTEFDDTTDYVKNWAQHGTANPVNGYLVIDGKGSGATHRMGLKEGQGILALFRYSSGTSAGIVLIDQLYQGKKYIGIKPGFDPSLRISLTDVDGKWIGGQELDGTLNFVADRWDYCLIEIKEGGQFYIKVWDKSNPKLFREKTLPMGSDWKNSSWYGYMLTNQNNSGKIEIDLYQEFQFALGAKP
ncbi:MAG: carboxypeptidase-like regulatory domain-containing protein [Chloroflexota bacterium]